MVDTEKPEWETYNKAIEPAQLTPYDQIYGNIRINCKKGDDRTTFTVGNKLIDSKDYYLIYNFKGFIINQKSNKKDNVEFKIKLHTWFGKNAGILKSYVEYSKIDLKVISFDFGGY